MNIVVYTITWNEEVFIPYFLEHYASFAQKIIVYDNESSDQTCEILQSSSKTEIRSFSTNNEFRDDIHQSIKNEAWKECKGRGVDFVIVVDSDELIYSPDIVSFLNKNKKYSAFECLGFDVYGERALDLRPILEQYSFGVQRDNMNKTAVFSPDRITDINYLPGAHLCGPEGDVVLFSAKPDLKLLHYKYINLDYVLRRHERYRKRLSELNRKNGWGRHYLYSHDDLVRMYEKVGRRSVALF